MHRAVLPSIALALVLTLGLAVPGVAQPPATTILVSDHSDWLDRESLGASISADGRFIAFRSNARTFVPGSGTTGHIFVRNRNTGKVRLVSVRSDGKPGDRTSRDPSISATGRFVAFASDADNLVEDDANSATPDVFVHDRRTGTTSLVSVDSEGVQSDGESYDPSISANGRFVAFVSKGHLDEDDSDDSYPDVFVHDRRTGITIWVNRHLGGEQDAAVQPAISADGNFVAYTTDAALADGDTNGQPDVYLYDRSTGSTEWVSASSPTDSAMTVSIEPSISADGRFVTYFSYVLSADEWDPDIPIGGFVKDRMTGVVDRVNVISDFDAVFVNDSAPTISGDGRYIAFLSYRADLVKGDTNGAIDVFVYDRRKSLTSRVSVKTNGGQAHGSSWGQVSISGHGRFVAFTSHANNLVKEDTNRFLPDVFVRGPLH